jgi:hypothetical protein
MKRKARDATHNPLTGEGFSSDGTYGGFSMRQAVQTTPPNWRGKKENKLRWNIFPNLHLYFFLFEIGFLYNIFRIGDIYLD